MLKKSHLLFIFIYVCSLSYAYSHTIYLTFDDGPLGGTENILSALEEEEVPAAFFMVGMHVERSEAYRSTLEKTKESIYILLGNHSYSHAFGRYKQFYSNLENVKHDMKKNNHVLELNTGKTIHARLPGRDVFRLPNLHYGDPFISKEEKIKEMVVYDAIFKDNFYLYGWDHEWEHHANGEPIQSVDKLANEIDEHFMLGKTLVGGELVLLMHDQMFRDEYNGKETLQQLIQLLKRKEYKIANLQEYIQ